MNLNIHHSYIHSSRTQFLHKDPSLLYLYSYSLHRNRRVLQFDLLIYRYLHQDVASVADKRNMYVRQFDMEIHKLIRC